MAVFALLAEQADVVTIIPAQTMADDIVVNASIPPMGSLCKVAQMIVFGMVVLKLRPLRASTTSVSARSQGVVAMNVTYYVALPLVMADDGVAAGEAVGVHKRQYGGHARGGPFAQTRLRGRARLQPNGRSSHRRVRRCYADSEVRRRAGRPERPVRLDQTGRECSRKKRSISLVASGPRGSV